MPRLHPLLSACLALGFCGATVRAHAAPGPELVLGEERRLSLNEGWRFLRGEAPGAEQPGFDDTTWRTLDLPHDWAIEGPFDEAYGARALQRVVEHQVVAALARYLLLHPRLRDRRLSLVVEDGEVVVRPG